MTETACAIVARYQADAQAGFSYCWNHLNLSRIGLAVFATNDRAQRLYASFGFETEGRLRRALFIDGAWIDYVMMGLPHPSRA